MDEQRSASETLETVSLANAFPQPVDRPRSAPSTPNWYCSVMWDNKVLEELLHHERADHKLYTKMGIVKLLVDKILEENESWPVIERLRWLESFILVRKYKLMLKLLEHERNH